MLLPPTDAKIVARRAEIVARLRETRRFPDTEALRAQLAADEREARKLL